MSRLNKIILIGNVIQQPESTTLSSGDTKTSFTLEVARPTTENAPAQSDIVSIVCWRDLATTASTFAPGTQLLVEGSIHNRNYEKDGQRFYITEVDARSCIQLANQAMPDTSSIPIIEEQPVAQPNVEGSFDFNEAIQQPAANENMQFATELGEDVPF